MYDRDRDRDNRDRDRDRGETYRPRDRDRDGYAPRGPAAADTYVPGGRGGDGPSIRGGGDRGGHRRSRSPPPASSYRRRSPPGGPTAPTHPRDNSWRDRERDRGGDRDRGRDRPRSPLPPPRGPRAGGGGYSPRRDDDRRPAYRGGDDRRYRSPPRGDRYARSPRRERSRSPGYGKRGRDYSTDRARSPPPKRERIASPRRYDSPPRRAYSPADRGRDFDRYERRGRSRSPRRDEQHDDRRRSYDEPPAPVSAATSRRSSPPPVHPSRMRLVPEIQSARSPYDSPARSPPRRSDSRDAEYSRDRDYRDVEESSYRNGDGPRAPPSGPAGGRSGGHFSPPSGPASGASAHGRYNGGNSSLLNAPSQPRNSRGEYRGGRGGYRGDYGGPPPRRGSDYQQQQPPSGPGSYRGGFGGSSRGRGDRDGDRGGSSYAPAFRGSANSSSTTYPRTQRFGSGAPPTGPAADGADHSSAPPRRESGSTHPYLSDLPALIPGGSRLPPRDPVADARLRRLEEEAEQLREKIAQKERAKRAALRDWGKMAAETETARLRGELAEENARIIAGEGIEERQVETEAF